MCISDYSETIDKIWNSVVLAERELAEKIDPLMKVKLRTFIESLKDVKRCYTKALYLHDQRQNLIELHCAKENLFLETHHQYHCVTEELLYEMRIFFSSYKTCLNALTLWLGEFIPEKERRGLRMKSFGSLIDSLDKVKPENKLANLIKILREQGQRIDKEFISYRDIMIEHPRQLSRGNIVSEDNMSRIMHFTESANDFYPNGKELDNEAKKIILEKVQLKMVDESYLYYYHIKLNVESGKMLNKGEAFGHVYDETKVHFETYGSHTHIFSSSDFKGNIMDSFGIAIKEIMKSPYPNIAWPELGIFVESILSELSVYK